MPGARVTTTQQAPVPRHSPTQPGLASGTEAMVAAAERAVGTVDDQTITLTGAQLMSDPASAGSLPMTTDEGPRLSAGSYLLAIYCAGSGHVTARLSVGAATSSVTAACWMVPQAIWLRLRAPRSGEAIVQIAARDSQPIAVAYKLASAGLPHSSVILPG